MADQEVVIDDIYRFGPAGPDEEVVYGACSPGWHACCDQQTAIEDWIEEMQSQGIERVCCLLAGRRLDASDANLGLYREAFGSEKVKHVPLPDRRLAPPDRLAEDVLSFLEGSVREGDPVVVHSLTGLEQTGRALSAWLVYGRGRTPREALDAVRETGRSPTKGLDGSASKDDLLDVLDRFATRREQRERVPI
ncbi:protein-tyrosine phosphatase family protein [Halovenus marina]|uniref:protein-tyrosine phosphatase family protein n=1 Tax=Halovenus marina TaxID=3396621 RepID=UPI003F54EA5A